jgi:hypothetical protein
MGAYAPIFLQAFRQVRIGVFEVTAKLFDLTAQQSIGTFKRIGGFGEGAKGMQQKLLIFAGIDGD